MQVRGSVGVPSHTQCMNMGPFEVSGVVRRVRRILDLSQRGLADRAGVSASAIARAETGRGTITLVTLQQVLRVAGLRLAVVDIANGEIDPMNVDDVITDRAGRKLPAHLDPVPTDPIGRPESDPSIRRDRPLLETYFSRRARRDLSGRPIPVAGDHPSKTELIQTRRLMRLSMTRPVSSPRTAAWYEEREEAMKLSRLQFDPRHPNMARLIAEARRWRIDEWDLDDPAAPPDEAGQGQGESAD